MSNGVSTDKQYQPGSEVMFYCSIHVDPISLTPQNI